jgi:hypothetical protein
MLARTDSSEIDETGAATTEHGGPSHGGAVVTGAIAGTVIVAMLVGSFLLVLLLLLGAVAGVVIAGLIALAADTARGRVAPSGDRRPPKRFDPDGGPAARREEAAGPSPEPPSQG